MNATTNIWLDTGNIIGDWITDVRRLQEAPEQIHLHKEIDNEMHRNFENDSNLIGPALGVITCKWRDCLDRRYHELSPAGFVQTQQLTVDAVFPYGRYLKGRLLLHTADNVETTTLALKYAKEIQLPGFLHVLLAYLD